MSEKREDIYVVMFEDTPLFAAKSARLANRLSQVLVDCKRVPVMNGMVVKKTKYFSPKPLSAKQLEGVKKALSK